MKHFQKYILPSILVIIVLGLLCYIFYNEFKGKTGKQD